MPEQYVILGNMSSEGQLDGNELNRLATHFHLNQHIHQGVLYVDYLPGLHISYDIKIGTVDLQARPINNSIIETYSASITSPLITNILMAISHYAKFDLLKKLNGLSETSYPPVAALQNIITRCGVSAISGAKIDTTLVAMSLIEICKHIKGNRVTYHEFDIRPIAEIRSLHDSHTNLERLKFAMRNSKNLNPAPPRA